MLTAMQEQILTEMQIYAAKIMGKELFTPTTRKIIHQRTINVMIREGLIEPQKQQAKRINQTTIYVISNKGIAELTNHKALQSSINHGQSTGSGKIRIIGANKTTAEEIRSKLNSIAGINLNPATPGRKGGEYLSYGEIHIHKIPAPAAPTAPTAPTSRLTDIHLPDNKIADPNEQYPSNIRQLINILEDYAYKENDIVAFDLNTYERIRQAIKSAKE